MRAMIRERIMGDVQQLTKRGEKNIKVIQRRHYIPFDSFRHSGQIVDVRTDPDLSSEFHVHSGEISLGSVDIDLDEPINFVVTR